MEIESAKSLSNIIDFAIDSTILSYSLSPNSDNTYDLNCSVALPSLSCNTK